MVWFANDIRAVLWVAVVSAFITVALLVLYVHEQVHVGAAAQAPRPVADTAPVELRGTAFGIFNLVSGGALLLASVIARALRSRT